MGLRRDVEWLMADDAALRTQPRPSGSSKPSGPSNVRTELDGSAPSLEPGVSARAEDPLAWLPCSTIVEYARGQPIYGPSQPTGNIYVVMEGKVKLCRGVADGRPAVIDFYLPDELFGESGLLGKRQGVEEAVAIEATRLMTWTTAEVERVIVARPLLGMSLIRLLTRRAADYGARIESLSTENVDRRLVRTLIRFSDRSGRESGDGTVDMTPFTHELLSDYLGSARELVTHYMNQLRSQGFLEYSRQGIALNRGALREWLKRDVPIDGHGGARQPAKSPPRRVRTREGRDQPASAPELSRRG